MSSSEDYYPNVDWSDPDTAKYYDKMAQSKFYKDCVNLQNTGRWNGPEEHNDDDEGNPYN